MGKKLAESLLLSKEQLNNKLQELKSEFPDKFKGVSDEQLLNNFKGISIDYLDGCTDLEFKEDDEPEGTIVDITGNSTDITNQPAYKKLMDKVFEEVVNDWLEDHNLTHKDIVSFKYDADTQQMFITFDANNIDFNNDEGIEVYQEEEPEETEELEEEYTREALTGLENTLYRKLRNAGLFPEDLYLDTDLENKNKLLLTILIDGDWKHEHMVCKKTIGDFAFEQNWKIVKENEESVRQLPNQGDDSYQAFHYYVFEIPEDQLAEDYINEDSLDETYSDEELDKLVGKTFNQQKIQNIYRRVKYNDSRLFAHTRCVNCGREKRVFLSNLINDPDKYGSCTCSDTNVESRLDNIEDLFDGSKKLSNNTSGYTGVSYVKTYKGELYDKWRAYIEVDGKRTYLGDFDSKSAAIRARKKAAEKGLKWYKEHKNEFIKSYRRKTKRYRKSSK